MTEKDKYDLFPLYDQLNDLFQKVVDDKIRVKRETLEKQQEFTNPEEMDRTLEMEKTQYIIEILDDTNDKFLLDKNSQNNQNQKFAVLSDKLDNDSNKLLDVPTETMYIEQQQIRIDLNTPLSRACKGILNKPGVNQNVLKRKALENHLNTGAKVLKTKHMNVFIKPEPPSIKEDHSSEKTVVKTYGNKLRNVELRGKGLISVNSTPEMLRFSKNQRVTPPDFNLSALQDDNGMITIIESVCDQSEISTIQAHEHSNTIRANNFTNNYSSSIKNQPQSTKNMVTLYNTADNSAENKDSDARKNDSFPSPPPMPSTSSAISFKNPIQIISQTKIDAPKFTIRRNDVSISCSSNNINSIAELLKNQPQSTIQNISPETESPNSSDVDMDAAPIWFQSFMLKFQTVIHRQNAIEEKLDNLSTNFIKLRRALMAEKPGGK